ncbi:MAG: selenide, water dikinase SelD [Gammaproteobacteria bacterium]
MQSTKTPFPICKDLVLLGGGHSHVVVLKCFAMRPVPGMRLTLIARDVHTPYSGMLPGHIAGHYGYDDSHIDLRPLAQFAGARLYHSEAQGLDLADRRVLCPDRPSVRYDVLSIDIGSRPRILDAPGAAEYALAVKPIDRFLQGWEKLTRRVVANNGRFRIIVVGGGAAGVELALCTQYRLRQCLAEAGKDGAGLEHDLVTDTSDILPTHNPRARAIFRRVLAERGVRVHVGQPVVRVTADGVVLRNGGALPADAVLWLTQAAAPQWLRAAGLATDEQGFIRVNDCLQSISHPEIFAAGDIATMVHQPRPKAGVFAVRQGPPLAVNLRRALRGQPFKSFKPQRQYLSLISTGDRCAVASRGGWALEGRWLWRLKDWIDRRFMEQFNRLPAMKKESHGAAIAPGLAEPQAAPESAASTMRCGGCGAKIGSDVLTRVLQRLRPTLPVRDDVLIGLDAPDDAAVLIVPVGQALVQTVDYFRAFIDDPYLFGRIAANHSLGDIYAMGARPQSALAIATLPYGTEADVEEQLYQLMAGALETLNASSAALVGGHSGEGAELAFGLAVTGLARREELLTKGGMQPGDALILTKALGPGTLFAAAMRRQAKGRWIDAAIAAMLMSNQAAAQCLRRQGAHACTDVTGFGLLGHLLEMARTSPMAVDIDLAALPILEGALDTLRLGIVSSLHAQNLAAQQAIEHLDLASRHPHFPLLFDPQTAGGLLASVPAACARACVTELQELGYRDARLIGQVRERGVTPEIVRLLAA